MILLGSCPSQGTALQLAKLYSRWMEMDAYHDILLSSWIDLIEE